MKDYIAIIIGTGEGCDYTIGCNMSYEFHSANNIEDVKKQIIEDFYCDEDEGYFEPDIGIEELIICEIKNKYEFDDIDEKVKSLIQNTKNKDKEKSERVEYERLKKKFGE